MALPTVLLHHIICCSLPQVLDGALLTCEEDIVKFMFQQLLSLLGSSQHHSKAALQGRKTAQETDSGQEDLPTGQDRGVGGTSCLAGRAMLTWSRYWGSSSASTFSVFLLISDGFSTTQFPARSQWGSREGRLVLASLLDPWKPSLGRLIRLGGLRTPLTCSNGPH